MIGRVPRWFPVVGIVMVASACDNVSWGGLDLSLRPPASDTTPTPEDSLQAHPPVEEPGELGPLLYAGARSGFRGRVVPVAEITPSGLRPLPQGPGSEDVAGQILRSRLGPGRELNLFHQGVRIGSLVLEENDLAEEEFCQPKPRGTGQLLLRPDAQGAQRFLAMEPGRGGPISFGIYRELASVYDQRVASLNLGAEAIPLVGAPWPPSLLDIRQELQILDLAGGEAPAVLATFMHQDQLQVGPAPAQAYSLMILGEPRGTEFSLAFIWYRPVADQGKGAPRYLSRVDWDGDGSEEILLEVLGAQSRWFAALDRGPEGWQVDFQDPCGLPADQGAGE